MNASAFESKTVQLTSETADYFLAKAHRDRLMAQDAQNRAVHSARKARGNKDAKRRNWLRIAIFAALMALLLMPLAAAQAQTPWQIDGEGDFYHPAIVEYKMGLFHLVRDEWGRAIARFDEAIRLLPEYAAAFEARGYCYEALANAEQAAADYLQAIHLTPEYGPTYRLLANLYYDQGQQA
ncbi:MAG: hypothetical protein IT323_08055, partial [Anaerolineae bacterium]|nr:hypothetical protein [Anaerolineae bacterium]